ncbi:hypothetical protein H2198_008107 [Neophaeococcomyces mojaviensis]|uniref:Uncharacterized protein n=1 Tax=Neophaeococcomyces mojaviensis TaxID=3383035 RepID=A0ACC2ZY72_9EURO|nr:hypothetical protein H2198_008107 [Knufia sp. JES_112]
MSRNTAPWYTMRHGLWAHDLAYELMWQPAHSVESAERVCRCNETSVLVHRRLFNVAPSWSWASISGPILPFHNTHSPSSGHRHLSDEEEENDGPLTSRISRANFIWDDGCQIISDVPGAWATINDHKIEAVDSSSTKCCLSLAGTEADHRFVSDLDVCEDGLVVLVALHEDLERQDYCGLVVREKDQAHNSWTRCGTFWGVKTYSWPESLEQDVSEQEVSSQSGWRWP